jgi:hypothetical protein
VLRIDIETSEDMFHFQTWTAREAVDVVVSGEGEKSQQQ